MSGDDDLNVTFVGSQTSGSKMTSADRFTHPSPAHVGTVMMLGSMRSLTTFGAGVSHSSPGPSCSPPPMPPEPPEPPAPPVPVTLPSQPASGARRVRNEAKSGKRREKRIRRWY